MKESKHQHRTRILEESTNNSPAEPNKKMEHWPVGPSPEASTGIDTASGPAGKEIDSPEKKQKKTGDSSDEWSVSWP
jgi:hypothetical protein